MKNIEYKSKCLKLLSLPFMAIVMIPMFSLLIAWFFFILSLYVVITFTLAAIFFGIFASLGWLLMICVALQALYNWSGDHFYQRQKAKAMKAAAKQPQLTSENINATTEQ